MLYFVPTPIGNLADISAHALEILSKCEIVICEDTRVGKSLFNLLSSRYDFKPKATNFYPLHTHNENEFFNIFKTEFLKEKICVYISDAGMPCISDPGIFLVKFAQKNDIKYEFLSGSNALLLAAAASGLIEKEFSFLGFLPSSGKEREINIQNLMYQPYPCIIYESPKRILNLIEKIALLDENRKIFAIKEATKKFETKFFGSAKKVLNDIQQNVNLNGEWALVIDKSQNLSQEKITLQDIKNLQIPPKIKAKLISKITGEKSSEIYEKLVKIS